MGSAIFQLSKSVDAGTTVTLNIYDLSESITCINSVLRPLGSGLFHCGVELFAWEWGFCDTPELQTGSGIFRCVPRVCEGFVFRESISQGRTQLSYMVFRRIIERMEREWPSDGYNLVRRNCLHFCDELCRALGVEPIPNWTRNLADAGAGLDTCSRHLAEGCDKMAPLPFRRCGQCADKPLREEVESISVLSPRRHGHR